MTTATDRTEAALEIAINTYKKCEIEVTAIERLDRRARAILAKIAAGERVTESDEDALLPTLWSERGFNVDAPMGQVAELCITVAHSRYRAAVRALNDAKAEVDALERKLISLIHRSTKRRAA